MSQVGSGLGSNESYTLQGVPSYQKSNAVATKRACTQARDYNRYKKAFGPTSSALPRVSGIDEFYRRCFWSCIYVVLFASFYFYVGTIKRKVNTHTTHVFRMLNYY